jgi:small subunit ribosomal protein S6
MRNYENLIIFDPEVSEEDREKKIELAKSVIEREGEILNIDRWGIKQLAYPINKKKTGYYVLMGFTTNEKLLPELGRELRLSKEVMRHFITHKLSKE